MRVLRYFVLLLLFSCLFFVNQVLSQTVNRLWVDGRIYFKIKDNATLNVANDKGVINPRDVYFLRNLVDKYGITEMVMPFMTAKSETIQRTFRLHFENIYEVENLIKELKRHPDIEYAEPAPLFFISLTPNDTYYNTNLSGGFLYGSANSSWHLNLINASAAWDVTTGDPNIVVAVLDNAIWIDHPDLQNKVVHAVDLGNGDNDPNPPQATYIWSHGTHSAGLIAAETNNGIGIASIGYNVSLMAIKLGDDASDGQAMAAGYEGIIYAADHGANVINMSWGSPQFFQTMQNIVNYAYNKGCVLVGAAGNNGNGMETQMNPDIPVNYVGYPAALNHVIAVGSCNIDNKKSDFSNYGTWIDVLAPGGYATNGLLGIGAFTVLSTTASPAGTVTQSLSGQGGGAATFGVSGNYDIMQGTSMAAPITSGLCALMLSANPNLTPEELTAILKSTCVNVNAQNPNFIDSIGAGRIDAAAAVTAAAASVSPLVANFMADNVVISTEGVVNFTDLSVGNPTSWSWTFEGGTPSTSNEQNPQNIQYNEPGIYSVTLTVSDGINQDTEIKTTFIIVGQSGSLAESGWIEQNTRFTSPYRGVFQTKIVDPNTVWILTYDGTGGSITRDFARTTDGGINWIPGTIDIPNNYAPGDISAVSGSKAWIAVYDVNGGGRIYKTEDGGQTWIHQESALFNNSASFPNVIHMFNENEGYCQGDPINGEFEIYVTSNGGDTWTLVNGNNIPNPQSGEMGWTGVADAVGNTVWFGTNKGRIYKSTDKGNTWQVYNTGQANVSRLSFADENNGVAICAVYNQQTGQLESWKMIKTNNGGQTWTEIPVASAYLSDVSAVPGTPGMYVGVKIAQVPEQNFSAYSLDYGTTWTMIDDSIQYTNVQMYNANVGWAGGFNWDQNTGGIYKWVGLPSSDEPYFVSSPVLDVISLENYVYNINAIDPNNLPLTITATEKPSWLNIVDNGNGTAILSGVAPTISGISQTYNVILRASNGMYYAEQQFTITVHTNNTAPYFENEETMLNHVQYVPFEYEIIAHDDDNDQITLNAVTLPSWATFIDNGDGTGLINGTPTSTSSLGYQFVIKAADQLFETTYTFRVKVTANGSPYFVSQPVTSATQNVNYVYNIVAEDPENEVLTITATVLPEWLTLVDNGDGTAILSGTPAEAPAEGYAVTLNVSDSHNSTEQSFVIDVTPNLVDDLGYGVVKIYPNPASDVLIVTNSQNCKYEISDVTGRVLKLGFIYEPVQKIDISELSQAQIVIKISNEQKVLILKVMKM